MKKKSFLFGVNVTQCAAGDFELYLMWRFHERHSLAIAGGYDVNFVDNGRHWTVDEQAPIEYREQRSTQWGRYFRGEGVSARIIYAYHFRPRLNGSNYFLAASLIFKQRSYSDYYFGMDYSHSESADQTIQGLTMNIGKNLNFTRFVFCFYIGSGLRNDISQIYWPAINHYQVEEKRFRYQFCLPSIDFGLVFYMRAKRLKDS